MIYENNGQETLHIIAVAAGKFEYNGRHYARFIKLLSISEDVHDLVKKLENKDSECLTDTPNEHRKLDQNKIICDVPQKKALRWKNGFSNF